MNYIIYLMLALFTLQSPFSSLVSSGFKGMDTVWTITSRAAILVLEEKINAANDESIDTDTTDDTDNITESAQQEDDLEYWNNLAYIYGFQAYNGYGTHAEFIEYAKRMVYNAETYGNPYYEEPIYEEPFVEDTTPSADHDYSTGLYEGALTDEFYWIGDEYRQGVWYQTSSGSWQYR